MFLLRAGGRAWECNINIAGKYISAKKKNVSERERGGVMGGASLLSVVYIHVYTAWLWKSACAYVKTHKKNMRRHIYLHQHLHRYPHRHIQLVKRRAHPLPACLHSIASSSHLHLISPPSHLHAIYQQRIIETYLFLSTPICLTLNHFGQFGIFLFSHQIKTHKRGWRVMGSAKTTRYIYIYIYIYISHYYLYARNLCDISTLSGPRPPPFSPIARDRSRDRDRHMGGWGGANGKEVPIYICFI